MARPVSLSIFFPAFNEEENVERAVREAMRVAEESPYIGRYEIIVVDDGSKDHTSEIAEALARRFATVRAVHHGKNGGYGAALITGLRAAQMEYVFFTDADCQFDILELNHLLAYVPDYDAVIGYRAPRRDPLMRLANARVWNLLNRFAFGLRVRDIDCAFKLFKRELVADLPLKSSGAMVSAETLIRLSAQGVAIKEAPVSHLPRVRGSATGAKPAVIARALGEMFELYRGDLRPVSHIEFLKYVAVGAFNTLLDASIYIALTRATPFFLPGSTLAKLLSFFAGTISSFILNRGFTFGIRGATTPAEIGRFYAAVSAAFVVNVASFYLLARVVGIFDILALVLSTGASFVVNYLLARLWVFRRRASPRLAYQ